MTSIVSWQNTTPEQLLAERFHITTGFHPEQREIIEQLVQGKRVLAIQRTGWGKFSEICTEIESIRLSPPSSHCRYAHKEALRIPVL